MKQYITKSILFLLLLMVILILTDYYITKKLLKSDNISFGEISVNNIILNDTTNFDYLIYGSSRAKSNVNELILNEELKLNSLNMGIQGHNFWLQYLRHKQYLEHHKPPKFIIINVDWMTFQKKKELYNFNQFLPFMLWDLEIYDYTKSYDGFIFLDYLIPNYRYFGRKELFFYSFSSLGNLNKKKNSEILDSVYINFHQPTIDLFIKFIAECKSLNIDLYLVHTPDYIANQNIYTNRDELIQLLDSISKSNNLIFIDYSNYFISANLKYFQDYGHLNEYGRNEFSKILSDSLKNLIKK